MNLTYEDVRSFVEAGDSVAEITVKLQADTRHVRNIEATSKDANVNSGRRDLLQSLSGNMGLMFTDENAGWSGPLVEHIKTYPEGHPLRVGFRKLLSVLQVSGRPVYCADHPPTGYLTTAITEICKVLVEADANNPYTAEMVQDEMDGLTGGVRFAGVTETDVQAVIDLRVRQDALDVVEARTIKAFEAAQAVFRSGGTATQIHEAAVTAWEV